MEATVTIRSAKERVIRLIPLDQIAVVHTRDREKNQFKENVRSIGALGLYKPILVNKRNYAAKRKYELVCGEGRLLAHKELGKTEIRADVIDVDEQTAYLMTLGENVARSPIDAIEFAKRLQEMHEKGHTIAQLSQITGRAESYLQKYLKLMAQGEERLIKGVEEGIFPLSFALDAVGNSDRSMQHLLMDAFDHGVVTTSNLATVRRVIEDRREKGKELSGGKKPEMEPLTIDRLKREIRVVTKEKESFVQEAHQKENRVFALIMALRKLREKAEFIELLKTEGLSEEPALKGNYQ